ncbi:HEPN domain-containing protein [Synechococcus sp. J7-Johnson]|uniref:HEPN domain-containing protein n=1 Tax=Synechococcus sp. J7-Johnson TaxID=2823737 RepID=UPI0020CEEEF2|nr:HEPN domain-containing protein [Synechococcus sp. J7-Johnson]MCP9841979.1 HEPN domain-containing protein [Synechococcus sp. J7-Johnson]
MQDDFRREAERMLRIAHRDLKTVQAMLEAGGFDELTWGFHLQQATEKALKAWISSLGQEYPYSHDLALLRRLIEDCAGVTSRFATLDQLSPFAAQLRYSDDPEPLHLDRIHWNQLCADLLAHVGSLLA